MFLASEEPSRVPPTGGLCGPRGLRGRSPRSVFKPQMRWDREAAEGGGWRGFSKGCFAETLLKGGDPTDNSSSVCVAPTAAAAPGAPPVRCAPGSGSLGAGAGPARARSTRSPRRALQRPLRPPPRKTGRFDLRCSRNRSPVTRSLKGTRAWPGPASSPFLPLQVLRGLARVLPRAGCPAPERRPWKGRPGSRRSVQRGTTSATGGGGGAGREAGKGRRQGRSLRDAGTRSDETLRALRGQNPSGGTSEAGHRWRGWELSCPLEERQRDKAARKGPRGKSE